MNRSEARETFDYTDGDAHNLLLQLVKYAEAFAGDHALDLTVEQLCVDLVETASDRDRPALERISERIFDALRYRR